MVETDCSSLTGLLHSKSSNKSVLFPLVSDTKHVMSSFKEFSIKAVRRGCNRLAHELAGMARREGDFIMVGAVPQNLNNILKDDCIFPSAIL